MLIEPEEINGATIYLGDSLNILPTLNTRVDAVITDPPYSAFRQGAGSNSTKRYFRDCSASAAALPPIEGESMDQHAYMNWTRWWMGLCRRVLNPGGILLAFTNHSMIVPTVDGMQQAGLMYRGIFVWHKPNHRPQLNRYTNACEFAVWGTEGDRGPDGKPVKGFFSKSPRAMTHRSHQNEKPRELMDHLISITRPGETILDPFMGSGSTLLSAVAARRKAIGIEASEEIYQIARRRLQQCQTQLELDV